MKTSDFKTTLKDYYYLTKPGIVRGNLLAGLAGFLVAAHGSIGIWKLLSLAVGLTLVLAASCVSNNYIDRGIDTKMARTQKRALVTGAISGRNALIYAAVLGITGTALLALGDNLLAAAFGVLLYVTYVFVYAVAKRRSVHGTLVGTIPGALPPVIGYVAVTGKVDVAALLLFIVLVCWQMPHFYAIAIYRLKDYKAAGVPVLPAVKGFSATKLQMIIYILLFTAAVTCLTLFGVTGVWFGIVMVIVSAGWLLQSLKGLRIIPTEATERWARGVFGGSLLVLTVFCVAIALDSFLT